MCNWPAQARSACMCTFLRGDWCPRVPKGSSKRGQGRPSTAQKTQKVPMACSRKSNGCPRVPKGSPKRGQGRPSGAQRTPEGAHGVAKATQRVTMVCPWCPSITFPPKRGTIASRSHPSGNTPSCKKTRRPPVPLFTRIWPAGDIPQNSADASPWTRPGHLFIQSAQKVPMVCSKKSNGCPRVP